METKKIFEETGRIGNNIKRIHQILDMLNYRCLEIMDLCPHEIVFKYQDNYSRKMPVDGNYFCPACGKTIRCLSNDDVLKTDFRASKIIPITNLSLVGNKETYYMIRNEVYNNMELYYNKTTNIQELSSRMEEILQEQEIDHNYTLRKK